MLSSGSPSSAAVARHQLGAGEKKKSSRQVGAPGAERWCVGPALTKGLWELLPAGPCGQAGAVCARPGAVRRPGAAHRALRPPLASSGFPAAFLSKPTCCWTVVLFALLWYICVFFSSRLRFKKRRLAAKRDACIPGYFGCLPGGAHLAQHPPNSKQKLPPLPRINYSRRLMCLEGGGGREGGHSYPSWCRSACPRFVSHLVCLRGSRVFFLRSRLRGAAGESGPALRRVGPVPPRTSPPPAGMLGAGSPPRGLLGRGGAGAARQPRGSGGGAGGRAVPGRAARGARRRAWCGAARLRFSLRLLLAEPRRAAEGTGSFLLSPGSGPGGAREGAGSRHPCPHPGSARPASSMGRPAWEHAAARSAGGPGRCARCGGRPASCCCAAVSTGRDARLRERCHRLFGPAPETFPRI